jgi:hypothetical protein
MVFTLSYVLLSGLVFCESLMLKDTLKQVVWMRQLYWELRRKRKPPSIDPRPLLSAPILDTGEALALSDLRGHSSILLFVSPDMPPYQDLGDAIHGLWHKAKGHLYLICSGGPGACHEIARDHIDKEYAGNRIPVVLDEEGVIAAQFLIHTLPQAVMVDKDGHVTSYGRPSPVERANKSQRGHNLNQN